MWDGKMKAVTFSYDDGITYDKRLVEIFNKYNLKCTFNLNSGIMSGASCWENKGVMIHRMNAKGLPELYRGHEIAVHCLTHAELTSQDEETIRNEIMLDKKNLEEMFGQEMIGMAYPYGTFNDKVVDIVKECGLKYARTTISSGSAYTPHDLLTLSASFHHKDERAFDIIEDFLNLNAEELEEPTMLYIWGHSYEFEVDNNWERIEKMCQMLSGREDIYYGTNAEVLRRFYE